MTAVLALRLVLSGGETVVLVALAMAAGAAAGLIVNRARGGRDA